MPHVIHRGGLTASKSLSIVEVQGKKGVLRVFLSISTWRLEEDTKVPEFFRNGLTINIPAAIDINISPGGC